MTSEFTHGRPLFNRSVAWFFTKSIKWLFNSDEPENEMLHQIVVLIEECWMHEPGGRLPSLRLKKNLGSIFKEMTILTGENPAATGANKHIQNIVHGSTNDSAVSVTTPTHSGTRDSPVTTWSFVYLHLEPSKLHDSQYTALSGKISSSKSLFQKMDRRNLN